MRHAFCTVATLLITVPLLTLTLPAVAEDDPPRIKVEDSGNPLSGDVEAIVEGERLYARWCVQCHGINIDGVSPRWGKWGADLRVHWRGFEQFIHIVAVGRTEKRMPPFGEFLDFDQISQIGAFLETRAIEGANWR